MCPNADRRRPSTELRRNDDNDSGDDAKNAASKGRKRRMGFGKRGKNSFTVQRSEEVLPGEIRGALSRGSSASSDNEGSVDGDRFAIKFYMPYKHTSSK